MCVFPIPPDGDKDRVYFLFDSCKLIECDDKGKPLEGHRWEFCTPQAFVRRHWKKKVSGFALVHVFGRSLTEFTRKCSPQKLA